MGTKVPLCSKIQEITSRAFEAHMAQGLTAETDLEIVRGTISYGTHHWSHIDLDDED
jgi:hypothetical protein